MLKYGSGKISNVNKLVLIGVLVLIATTIVGKHAHLQESAPWALPEWKYRIKITVRENAGKTLTDYPIKIVINTYAPIAQRHMRDDCGDIRFVDMHGNQLPYWIERGCSTTQTIIWVKVPRIPANQEQDIFMYYGNPEATPESNGYAVFTFFDDFLDNRHNWQLTQHAEILNGHLHIPCDGADGGYAQTPLPIELNYEWNYEVSYKGYSTGTCGYNYITPAIVIYDRSARFRKAVWLPDGIHGWLIDKTWTGKDTTTPPEYNYTHIVHLNIAPTTTTLSVEYGGTDTWGQPKHIDTVNAYGTDNLITIRFEQPWDLDFYIDWVYIRKSTTPEPTYTLGEEEEQRIPTSLSLQIS